MSNMNLRLIDSFLFLMNRNINLSQKAIFYFLIKKAKINHSVGNIPVFIVSFPKSGTTWMQNIVHQILSDGDTSFDHIDQVSPYLENAYLFGLHNECIGKPVKTHLPYAYIPKSNSKYIYLYREGRDVALSFYHQYNLATKSDSEEHFMRVFLKGIPSVGFKWNWFKHLEEWFENRDKLDVLFVGYHQLKSNLPEVIADIAKFLGSDLSMERISSIADACSFESMKLNEHKFALGAGVRPVGGPPPAPPSLIREGKVGGGRPFMGDEETKEYLRLARKRIPAHILEEFGL